MKHIHTDDKYDYYLGYGGVTGNSPIYNIVPKGSEPPSGGYFGRTYIEGIKGVKFPKVQS